MSKNEWVLLIGLVIFIDVAQALMSLAAIGLVINRFLNIGIGILLPFGLHTKGVDMIDVKKMGVMLVAFGGEELAVGDFLPLWTIAVVLTYVSVEGEKNPDGRLGKIGKVLKTANKVASVRNPLNKDGVRLPRKPDTI